MILYKLLPYIVETGIAIIGAIIGVDYREEADPSNFQFIAAATFVLLGFIIILAGKFINKPVMED